jgi:hypothetical protein
LLRAALSANANLHGSIAWTIADAELLPHDEGTRTIFGTRHHLYIISPMSAGEFVARLEVSVPDVRMQLGVTRFDVVYGLCIRTQASRRHAFL